MKILILLALGLQFYQGHAQEQAPDVNELIGTWILDLTPENDTDEIFAMMEIEQVKDNTISGIFYREGVKMRAGAINTQTGIIHGALMSGDNSGEYNTAFYLKDSKLYGTTHAVDREFLSVWVAVKE